VKPTVVFLHGLARTHRSLARLRRAIERAGHPTWARSYPSRRLGLPQLGAWLTRAIRHDLGDVEVFGVTHSLGGIVARHMPELRWRGCVMLAPPNRGSRVAVAFGRNPVFRWYFGPAGQQVQAAEGWPLPARPFAVIAGTTRLSPVAPPGWVTSALSLLPSDEESDGILTVEETRLPGMASFAKVPASHTWIMDHPAVAGLVLAFLERGRFPESPD
jgi:hypothetical protein